jgi:hypothetical protein
MISEIKSKLDLMKFRIRYELCTRCENFNKENSKCKLCGCYMKVKVMLPNAACPQKYW